MLTILSREANNHLAIINTKEVRELERKNQLLKAKYDNDEKYARLHKRLMEKDPLTDSESKLFEALKGLKKDIDEQILQNAKILENESFIEKMMMRLVHSIPNIVKGNTILDPYHKESNGSLQHFDYIVSNPPL